jgi:hypothetical protein
MEARRRDADGIICGHIHHASDRNVHGTHYLNCGDWVESCTAVVESHDGELRVIKWAEIGHDRAAQPQLNLLPAAQILPPAVVLPQQ